MNLLEKLKSAFMKASPEFVWFTGILKDGEPFSAIATTWSATPPTEPGWYWVYFPMGYKPITVCVSIGFDPEGNPFDNENDDCGWNIEAATHFLGPLPLPDPPKVDQ
jgi:hypothetical protein